MKIRHGFVSNSSSSSFLITNKTDEVYTMSDFIAEHQDSIVLFIQNQLTWYTLGDIMATAGELDDLHPGNQELSFSNEDGCVANAFFRTFFAWQHDTISDNFEWELRWNSQAPSMWD